MGVPGRIVSGALSLMFLGFASLQLNDPDPLTWISIYGAAAGITGVCAARGRIPWRAPAAVGAVALVWAAIGLPDALPGFSHREEVFGAMTMKYPGVEEAREMLGLLIVAAAMAGVALSERRAPAAPRGAGASRS